MKAGSGKLAAFGKYLPLFWNSADLKVRYEQFIRHLYHTWPTNRWIHTCGHTAGVPGSHRKKLHSLRLPLWQQDLPIRAHEKHANPEDRFWLWGNF